MQWEIYIDVAGEFRFRLRAENGEILCVGEGYKNQRDCMKTIEQIKTDGAAAPVVIFDE